MAVKDIPDEQLKRYYTIGEVAKALDLAVSQIRYWEKEFAELKPKRGGGGERFFTKEDMEVVKTIRYLVKERGHTVEGAKAHLKAELNKSKRPTDMKANLQEVRDFLVQLRDEL